MDKQDVTTVIIEWKGPFLLDELKGREEGNGIYLLTGSKVAPSSRKRNPIAEDELQYCGITEQQFCKRVKASHEKVKLIDQASLRVWIGCLMYPKEQIRQHLETAEAAFVSFWDIKMNDKKKRYYPKTSVCIVSRWHKPSGNPYKKFPADIKFIKLLNDVLWWDTEEWRVGDLHIYKFSD